MDKIMLEYKEMLARPVQHIAYRQLFVLVSESLEDFAVVFEFMFDEDERVAWHAAWICEKASERSPWLFSAEAVARMAQLAADTPFTGLQRLLLSMLLNLGLPAGLPVGLINASFGRMVSPQSPVAVQVLSMKLLYELTRQEPAFRTELLAYLESADVENHTAGYRSARKNILKKLQKDAT